MQCPYCKHVPSAGVTHCDRCGLMLARDASGGLQGVYPPIKTGETLCLRDFRVDPLPYRWTRDPYEYKCGSKRLPTQHGIELTVVGTGDFEFAERYLNVRDTVVRAQFVLLSPFTHCFVMARHQKLDAFEVAYMLTVRSDNQTASVVRRASSEKGTTSTRLLPATANPAVAPLGHPNLLELGVQGPTIHAFVNGRHVGAFHDPILGMGSPAMGGGCTEAAPARILFQWFEARAVVA